MVPVRPRTTDPRFRHLPLDQAFYRCPATTGCEGDDVFTVAIRAPDGEQRVIWGCRAHVGVEVEAAVNGMRRDVK